ncbi:Uncharacterized protein, UPF0548 family [Deinococcus hopiensis KR-140]|uniref:Uncharacterized protein, UPF0548 family n=2 Tax=Deinococcus TaxID=1298 RepID=A0A1W1UKI9_9DEIO|nr:Uncharacterized protein, UPF0548 family [Deinococcus hopiensis KR-140]
MERLRSAELSYAPAGMTDSPEVPPGMQAMNESVLLGHGQMCFERARAALMAWQTHRLKWLSLQADGPPRVGQTVLLGAYLGPLTWLFGCRVVAVTDSPVAYAYTYGTLPGHPECGEERFRLELHPDQRLTFSLRAYSRPAGPLIRVVQPLATLAQRAGSKAYLQNMRRSTRSSGP